ncbi:hypothetical protein JTB14_015560 [Gonioctena quinquepunctata]|nr:hypothetical protein JTB14_015560 [Gonioctena quinquepunctata]
MPNQDQSLDAEAQKTNDRSSEVSTEKCENVISKAKQKLVTIKQGKSQTINTTDVRNSKISTKKGENVISEEKQNNQMRSQQKLVTNKQGNSQTINTTYVSRELLQEQSKSKMNQLINLVQDEQPFEVENTNTEWKTVSSRRHYSGRKIVVGRNKDSVSVKTVDYLLRLVFVFCFHGSALVVGLIFDGKNSLQTCATWSWFGRRYDVTYNFGGADINFRSRI